MWGGGGGQRGIMGIESFICMIMYEKGCAPVKKFVRGGGGAVTTEVGHVRGRYLYPIMKTSIFVLK